MFKNNLSFFLKYKSEWKEMTKFKIKYLISRFRITLVFGSKIKQSLKIEEIKNTHSSLTPVGEFQFIARNRVANIMRQRFLKIMRN